MRKLFLISAMVLASAAAHASDSRSLTITPADENARPVVAAPIGNKTVDASGTQVPTYIERPSVVDTGSAQPAVQPVAQPAAQCAPAAAATAPTTTADNSVTATSKPVSKDYATTDKPKRRTQWNEARIVSELHRHGIYW